MVGPAFDSTAECDQCDKPIRWNGSFWAHTDGQTYKHPTYPKAGTICPPGEVVLGVSDPSPDIQKTLDAMGGDHCTACNATYNTNGSEKALHLWRHLDAGLPFTIGSRTITFEPLSPGGDPYPHVNGERWIAGMEPLVPMSAPFVVAIDAFLAAQAAEGRAEAALRSARGEVARARQAMRDAAPVGIDNVGVGRTWPNVIDYRRNPRGET